jgi:hypothetical protein
MNIYYVYQYLRESDSESGKSGTPYYIGKGSNNRAYVNQRIIPKPSNKEMIQIISDNLTESEAFILETDLIKKYGRIDLGTGILRNKTDGGEGSTRPANKVAWNKGKSQSKEHNEKISKSLKGRKLSPEHIANLSAVRKENLHTIKEKLILKRLKEKLGKHVRIKLMFRINIKRR